MKSPLVTVIITTKNEEANIGSCLESIRKQSYSNIEINVVDNNSTDNTRKVTKKYTKNLYTKGPERSSQRNTGAKKARGKYFLFLDADMIVERDVVKACVEEMLKSKELYALVIPERSVGTGFWAKCKELERSFYIGVDWMEAARFFRADIFKDMNGYDENNTGTEDYDLPQRIQLKYGKEVVGRIEKYIIHNEGNFSLLKSMKKKYYYAKNLNVYKTDPANKQNFSKQASLLKRYLLFLSNPEKLFKTPKYGIGMLFMKTMEFASGFFGLISSKRYEKSD